MLTIMSKFSAARARNMLVRFLACIARPALKLKHSLHMCFGNAEAESSIMSSAQIPLASLMVSVQLMSGDPVLEDFSLLSQDYVAVIRDAVEKKLHLQGSSNTCKLILGTLELEDNTFICDSGVENGSVIFAVIVKREEQVVVEEMGRLPQASFTRVLLLVFLIMYWSLVEWIAGVEVEKAVLGCGQAPVGCYAGSSLSAAAGNVTMM